MKEFLDTHPFFFIHQHTIFQPNLFEGDPELNKWPHTETKEYFPTLSTQKSIEYAAIDTENFMKNDFNQRYKFPVREIYYGTNKMILKDSAFESPLYKENKTKAFVNVKSSRQTMDDMIVSNYTFKNSQDKVKILKTFNIFMT